MGKTCRELFSEVRREIKEISVDNLLKAGRKLVLLDVWEREEVKGGPGWLPCCSPFSRPGEAALGLLARLGAERRCR